ncbi:hypothetical protein CHS0354_014256 [Potamilus streckersoni]|uniref:G-protein coupled receptors family 1 profile domain-containing protein n=1 Tax=Potamilus streckersoni TaxID=2493646 RepID=A0AAE0T1W5_9BIVA|nr:hypothetical protein CHS0354_014256 [Potamilus streckersoni]
MYTPLKDLPEGKNWTLNELNDREVQLLIPVILFISISMAVGTAGNAFVLYVNIVVLKLRNSTHKYFINSLALVDTAFCLITSPIIIADLSHPYTFTNIPACKSLCAFGTSTAMASVFILFVIALDRYRRICKPHGNQFSLKSMKYIFGIIAVLCCVVSIPRVILYGKNTVQTGFANITGISCFPDDMYKDTVFPNVYNGFLTVVFVILTALMSIFYILIWRQIWKNKHPIQTNIVSDTNDRQIHCITSKNPTGSNRPGKNIKEENKGNKNKNHTVTTKNIRSFKILFVVTTIFILSFAPFLILELLSYLDEHFIENLDNTSTVFYQIFIRTYAINFMVNPFIYGVMDRKFRTEFRNLVLKRLYL